MTKYPFSKFYKSGFNLLFLYVFICLLVYSTLLFYIDWENNKYVIINQANNADVGIKVPDLNYIDIDHSDAAGSLLTNDHSNFASQLNEIVDMMVYKYESKTLGCSMSITRNQDDTLDILTFTGFNSISTEEEFTKQTFPLFVKYERQISRKLNSIEKQWIPDSVVIERDSTVKKMRIIGELDIVNIEIEEDEAVKIFGKELVWENIEKTDIVNIDINALEIYLLPRPFPKKVSFNEILSVYELHTEFRLTSNFFIAILKHLESCILIQRCKKRSIQLSRDVERYIHIFESTTASHPLPFLFEENMLIDTIKEDDDDVDFNGKLISKNASRFNKIEIETKNRYVESRYSSFVYSMRFFIEESLYIEIEFTGDEKKYEESLFLAIPEDHEIDFQTLNISLKRVVSKSEIKVLRVSSEVYYNASPKLDDTYDFISNHEVIDENKTLRLSITEDLPNAPMRLYGIDTVAIPKEIVEEVNGVRGYTITSEIQTVFYGLSLAILAMATYMATKEGHSSENFMRSTFACLFGSLVLVIILYLYTLICVSASSYRFDKVSFITYIAGNILALILSSGVLLSTTRNRTYPPAITLSFLGLLGFIGSFYFPFWNTRPKKIPEIFQTMNEHIIKMHVLLLMLSLGVSLLLIFLFYRESTYELSLNRIEYSSYWPKVKKFIWNNRPMVLYSLVYIACVFLIVYLSSISHISKSSHDQQKAQARNSEIIQKNVLQITNTTNDFTELGSYEGDLGDDENAKEILLGNMSFFIDSKIENDTETDEQINPSYNHYPPAVIFLYVFFIVALSLSFFTSVNLPEKLINKIEKRRNLEKESMFHRIESRTTTVRVFSIIFLIIYVVVLTTASSSGSLYIFNNRNSFPSYDTLDPCRRFKISMNERLINYSRTDLTVDEIQDVESMDKERIKVCNPYRMSTTHAMSFLVLMLYITGTSTNISYTEYNGGIFFLAFYITMSIHHISNWSFWSHMQETPIFMTDSIKFFTNFLSV